MDRINLVSFHKAHKPQSGAIGSKTSRLLMIFLSELFKHHSRQVTILKGSEPVDLICISGDYVLFAEIKAAPLVTLPLVVDTDELVEEVDGQTQAVPHRHVDMTQLYRNPLNIVLPIQEQGNWASTQFALGAKIGKGDLQWAYRGLLNLVKSTPAFLPNYLEFWRSAYDAYSQKSRSDVFWLTNACGAPSPRPSTWQKRRSGSGYESISDSKTSVGMDRTDDLKKATYQVLKIGAEGKPASKFHFTVGIVSNLPATRHFDEYIQSLKDIVWTQDIGGRATVASDLDPTHPMFNLFDGIIALPEVIARDQWLAATFNF